jgi:hypothetical protein
MINKEQVINLPRYTLQTAWLRTKNIEKTRNMDKIIYFMWKDTDSTVPLYVGVGGKGDRKGSGRLKEHIDGVTSCLKNRFYQDWIEEDHTRPAGDLPKKWNSFKWSFYLTEKFGDVKLLEKIYINYWDPTRNIGRIPRLKEDEIKLLKELTNNTVGNEGLNPFYKFI